MFFTRWGYGALPRSQGMFLRSHLEGALALENEIYLILLAVNVSFLLLTRFKAIDVAKESRRLKDVVFLHFLNTKRLIII
jgi:hypothetical protein